MNRFNSPAFAIRYLKSTGHLVKERPASDIKDNSYPILTFIQILGSRPKLVEMAMLYLRDEHDYVMKLEKEFATKPASW